MGRWLTIPLAACAFVLVHFISLTTAPAEGDQSTNYKGLRVQVPPGEPFQPAISGPAGPSIAPGPGRPERIFLKLGNLKGKAVTPPFGGQLVLQTFSYQIVQAGEWEDGGRLSGRVTRFADFKFVKEMDVSSPALALACARKEQFPSVEVVVPSGEEMSLKLTLDDVIVSSVTVDHQEAWPNPVETVTLKYRKAMWEFGPAKAGYDPIREERR